MSVSNDSEDENLKNILEAVDTSFFSNSLFNTKQPEQQPNEHPISQRNLTHEKTTNEIDFVPSKTVQKIMAKKLSSLLQDKIEFIKTSEHEHEKPKKKKRKSRVRLLQDCDCYVKPYEDFEYEELGPKKKPDIKRRNVDNQQVDEQIKIKSVAVDGEFVLSLKETESWSDRKRGNIFHYRLGKGINKSHNLIEPDNEFSKTRRKNQWNESKIKKAKFSSKP